MILKRGPFFRRGVRVVLVWRSCGARVVSVWRSCGDCVAGRSISIMSFLSAAMFCSSRAVQLDFFGQHAARFVRAFSASPRREDVHVFIVCGEVLDGTGEEEPRKQRASRQPHSAASGIGVPSISTTASCCASRSSCWASRSSCWASRSSSWASRSSSWASRLEAGKAWTSFVG